MEKDLLEVAITNLLLASLKENEQRQKLFLVPL